MLSASGLWERDRARVEVATFLACTYLAATGLALALPGTEDSADPVQILSMVVPAVAVGLLSLRPRVRRTGGIGWRSMGWRPAVRSWPVAVVLPALVTLPAFLFADLAGLCDFDDLPGYLAGAPFSLVLISVLALGEEIGWRGYLLPRVQMLTGRGRASLLTGLAHGLFHVPLLTLTYGYDSEGSRWIVVPGAIATMTLAGVAFAWLRDRSGSIWPVAIAHATFNVCLLSSIDDLVTTDHPTAMAYLAGEAGLLTIASLAAVAVVILRSFQRSPIAAGARRLPERVAV